MQEFKRSLENYVKLEKIIKLYPELAELQQMNASQNGKKDIPKKSELGRRGTLMMSRYASVNK